MANDMTITGTKGCVKLPKNMWCPVIVETPEKTYEFPLPDTKAPCNYIHSSGLRYEAIEVRECLKKGVLESSIMPLEDSIKLAEIMDEIRQQIGVKHED
ncbi:Trans-1,2-dihydrobenzene-1,2-diol dehydrogenase, partial [Stegodyphus mimosarum]